MSPYNMTFKEKLENTLGELRDYFDDAITAEEAKQTALQRELDDMQDALIDLQEDCAKAIEKAEHWERRYQELVEVVGTRTAQHEAQQQ